MTRNHWMVKFVASACLPALLGACDVKADLSAYLRKGDAAAEPAASATTAPRHAAIAAGAASAGGATPPRAAYSAAPASAPSVREGAPLAAARDAPLPATAPAQAVAVAQSAPLQRADPGASTAPPSAAAAVRPWSGPGTSAAPLVTAAPAVAPPIPQLSSTGGRNVSVGGAAVSGGNVSNAARVVAGLRKGLRDCYARENSDAAGSIRFTIKVGPTGSVTSTSAQPSGGLSSQLVACATGVIRAAKFEAPEGGSAVIAVPATFVLY